MRLTWIALLLGLAAPVAFGQGTPPAAPAPGGGGKRDEIKKRFDTDGDGKLSKEERRAAHQARRERIREKLDTDGDGKVSKDERRAHLSLIHI